MREDRSGEHQVGQTEERCRIGVISDTHNLLRPEVVETLRGCDAILHGGDVCDRKTLERLREIAPVYAVRGNNDRGPWAEELPEQLRVTVAGIRFFLVHDRREIPEGFKAAGTDARNGAAGLHRAADSNDLAEVDVAVFGHSHKYFCQEREGILYLNPGSCGRRRFGLPVTMAVIEAAGGAFKVTEIDFTESLAPR